jgi:hypothetical protein
VGLIANALWISNLYCENFAGVGGALLLFGVVLGTAWPHPALA